MTRRNSAAELAWLRLCHAVDNLLDDETPPPCCCHDVDWFSDDPDEREAAAHRCAPCPVIAACGEYADAVRPGHGVWGGRDRTKTRKSVGA